MKLAKMLSVDAASSSKGDDCSNLRGRWQNNLGSVMTIQQDGKNHIIGEYTTAVGSREGVQGGPFFLTGVVKPLEEGSLVSWNVMWRGGKSMTTWVGQCVPMRSGPLSGPLSGRKCIYATWLLKTMESDPDDKKWFSNRIDRDEFVKVEDAADAPELIVKQVEKSEDLVGRWHSDFEDAFSIDVAAKIGSVSGVYLTPDGSTSAKSPDLIGLTIYENHYTAVAFSAAGQHEVKGWTGFMYDYPVGDEGDHLPPFLKTSWISHTFSQNDPRRCVKFGMDDYHNRDVRSDWISKEGSPRKRRHLEARQRDLEPKKVIEVVELD